MFLQPSKFKENWLKYAQIIAIFKVCEKKKIKKKNMKNMRRTLKVCISVMAMWIRLKFGMECALPWRIFHSKNGAVLFRHYRVTDV